MAQFYSHPEREQSEHALPDAEVFYVSSQEAIENASGDGPMDAGWYYWFCFPGCLPDGEPNGPFETEQAAIDDCRDFAESEMDSLYETTEQTLITAHQSGIIYWKRNLPIDATVEKLRFLARTLGFRGEHEDSFVAGVLGERRRAFRRMFRATRD